MPVTINHATLDEIVSLYHRIPEFTLPVDNAALQQRIAASAACALIAYIGEEPAGFKLGYALDKDNFYSRLGACCRSTDETGLRRHCWKPRKRGRKRKVIKAYR